VRRRHQGHEPMHPVGTCRSCTMRRNTIVHSRRRPRKVVRDRVLWSPAEDRILVAAEGVLTMGEITQMIKDQIGTTRTENAVRLRMNDQGLTIRLPGLTISEVAYQMGVEFRTARRWLIAGYLGARNGRHCMGTVSQGALDGFVRERTDLYDRLKITSPRLRGIAHAAWTRDPWLEVGAVARFLARSPGVIRRLMGDGSIPARKTRMPQGGIRWVARRSDVLRVASTHAHGRWPHGHTAAV
jgi:transposase-like protein